MSDRTPIPKRLRFEVLRRDSFTCRYCGRQPPEVVLHLDHIVPVANGGTNDLENLVTACLPCNIGKGIMDARAPEGVRLSVPVGERPPVEFFWKRGTAPGTIVDARCLIWPNESEESSPWEWEEFNRYWNGPYSTHGASTRGFSPHEAAMYAAEILHNRWSNFRNYLDFIFDLMICSSAGHLPAYIAPFVMRALHIEIITDRCGRRTSVDGDALDGLARQAAAIFATFLASQHEPWRGR